MRFYAERYLYKYKQAIVINKAVDLHNPFEAFCYIFHLLFSCKMTYLNSILIFSFDKRQKSACIDLIENYKVWN